MDERVALENRAGLARITCGWRKAHLERDAVRNYWRDVHSPAISRRAGLYEYRHSPFDPVDQQLFGTLDGIDCSCPADAQLQWQSDVRYLDDAGLDAFGASPPAPVKAHLLADIELLVDRSTTYRAVGANTATFLDRTVNPVPVGPARTPTYALFFRQRGDIAAFHGCLARIAQRWSAAPGVQRLRLNLFEVPDMEAEKKAGYPIKTHPPEQQYQAFMELVVADAAVPRALFDPAAVRDCAAHVHALHAYPVPAVYTFVYRGRPTLLGLRGYAACQAIDAIGATNQRQPGLLEWMYGSVAQGGPVESAP